MYRSSVYLHFIADTDNKNILRMFFEDWTDRIGNNSIKYSAHKDIDRYCDIVRVDFTNDEDATIMRLIGIPEEFQKYIKFADYIPQITIV